MSNIYFASAVLFLGTAISAPALYAQVDVIQDRTFSEKAGAYANMALEFDKQYNYKAALAELDKALALKNLSPYERSTLYQMKGSAYYHLNDYKSAITAFENAINAGGMTRKEVEALELNIAQLLIADNQYELGAKRMERYFREVDDVHPKHAELLMSAWIAIEQYERALPWAKHWFDQANPKERKHFDVLNFIYHETDRTEEQIELIKLMVQRLPYDETLWKSWASLLVKAGREREAFDVNKLHYETGRVTDEASIIKLVEYYGYYDMPFEGARLLEYEINRGNVSISPERLILLADLYTQAREHKRALPILERAVELSPDPKLYARLGEALYQDKQCERSESALRQAIGLGYDHGKAWSLIGACNYEKAQASPRLSCAMTDVEIASAPRTTYREKAKAAYQNVRMNDELAGDAQAWIKFIEGEFEAFHNRCHESISVEKDLCFIKWDHSYRSKVFVKGHPVLDDPMCKDYEKEYLAKFRPSAMSKN